MEMLPPALQSALHLIRHEGWVAFTWLGDSGLLLPLALLITLWLAASRRTWPTALLWVLLFGAGCMAVLLSKLAFMGWGIGIASLDFTGFSGHSAMAASVWPVALWLFAARARHGTRVALVCLGWLLAGGIGVSRLVLDAHSPAEVVTGLALGFAVSASFLALQRRSGHPSMRGTLVVASLLLLVALRDPGVPAPTQHLLERIAVRLSGTERPFTREDLRAGRSPRRVSAEGANGAAFKPFSNGSRIEAMSVDSGFTWLPRARRGAAPIVLEELG